MFLFAYFAQETLLSYRPPVVACCCSIILWNIITLYIHRCHWNLWIFNSLHYCNTIVYTILDSRCARSGVVRENVVPNTTVFALVLFRFVHCHQLLTWLFFLYFYYCVFEGQPRKRGRPLPLWPYTFPIYFYYLSWPNCTELYAFQSG